MTPAESLTSAPPDRAAARALFLVNSLGVGGAEKQVVSLVNRLEPSRLAVSLLQIKHDDALRAQLDPARCTLGTDALRVRKGLDWPALARLARQIDTLAPDLLVCTNMYALAWGAIARALSRRGAAVKLVEVFHTTLPGSRKEALQMRLARPLLARTDLLVYVCQAQATHWRRAGLRARREEVVHNGIDTAHFTDNWTLPQKAALRQRHGIGASDYVLGLCAVMRPEKAHGDLLTALAQLAAGGLRVHALLIGDGPERPRIEAQVDALGLRAQVHITGTLADVRPAIAACDAMVIPSRAVETFSIAALEAMALGKPMLMSDIGGAREQVEPGDHGLLHAPGDVEALATHIRRLADPRLRRRMGERARERVVASFDVEAMARRYEGLLMDVARSGSPMIGS
jgi:glycosyltransferase involved in cell wall biosynthesis